MKIKSAVLILLLSVAAYGQEAAKPVPEIPYDSVADLLKLPADLHLGEVAGIAINSKRHLFVFSRGTTTGPARAAIPHRTAAATSSRQAVRARARPSDSVICVPNQRFVGIRRQS